jgi:hypothetical protein
MKDGDLKTKWMPRRPMYVNKARCSAAERRRRRGAPYVSVVAGAVAVSRLVSIASGCPCTTNEVRWLSEIKSKIGPAAKLEATLMHVL